MQVIINPRITRCSETKVAFWHGCLSAINEMMGEIATYEWIEYQAFNEKGQPISGKLTDMGAIIFQHEFRHLLGGIYLDYSKNLIDRNKLRQLFQSGEQQPYRVLANDSIPLLLTDYHIGESIEEYNLRKNMK